MTHSAVYFVAGDSYSDLTALRSGGIIDLHYIIHGGGSSAPTSVVSDCNAAGLSPILNNGNDGAAGWNGSDSYNANLATQGWHAVGGESEQAAEIDSIMSHLIFLDYGGEGTGGGTDDDVWNVTHPGPVSGHGAASYMETYDSNSDLWGWDVMGSGMQHAKAHGVKEIGMCVGTWMINHSTAQDYINIAQQMEANGITFAGIGVWGGYGSNANSVYNEFESWYKAWQAIWPPTNVTMKNRFSPAPPPPPPKPIAFAAFAPALCSWAVGRLDEFDEFAVGSDTALWHRAFDGTQHAWESLGGQCTSAPTAVTTTGDLIDVFVRGTNGAVWRKEWNGKAWLPWTSLGGGLKAGTGPSAISRDGKTIDIEVIGINNVLFRKSWNGTAWSTWLAVATSIQ